jgi:hypothetical protein
MLCEPVNCNLLAAVHSQPADIIQVWIQAVTETYPTMVWLHLCTPRKHPSYTCPWCSANVPETLTHFLLVCTAFHHARTADHNQVWQAITSTPKRTLQPERRLFIETIIRDTGLFRGPLDHQPSVRGSQNVPDLTKFGNLRPDAVVVNEMTRQIAILDLTRPFDRGDRPANERRHAEGPELAIPGVRARGLEATMGGTAQGQGQISGHLVSRGRRSIQVAGERKFEAYGGFAKLYNGAEWRLEILPWVVGVRCILDTVGIGRSLEFLDVPVKKRQGLMKITGL